MRRGLLAAVVAVLACAAPARAQVIPLPTATPTATPAPTAVPSPTPVGGTGPPVVAPVPGLSAVAAGQDAARSGSSADAALAGPLGAAWAVDLGGAVGSIVTGGGRIYVSRAVDMGTSVSAATDAFDAASGRRLWSLPFGGQLAYGEERLAVLSTGQLVALDAATGATVWTAPSRGSSGDDVLVAGGAVYRTVGSSPPQFQALALDSGAPLWTANTLEGGAGRPSVSGDRMYYAGACHAGALDRRNGATIWDVEGGCSTGGGGGPATLWADRLFPGGTDELGPVAAADGARLAGASVSVVTGDVGLSLLDGVDAVRLPAGEPLWKTPGIAVLGLPGAAAIRGEDGRLAIRDAATGDRRWTGRLRLSTQPAGSIRPLNELVAGEGRLLVVNGTTLVALAPRGSVPGAATTLRPTIGPAGRAFRPRGRVAGPLLPPSVRLELRTGKRWRTAGSARPASTGAVRPRVTLRRNAVARIAGPGLAPSRPVRLYAQPVIATRFVASTGRVVARVRLGRLPGVGRAGRRVAVYVVRGRSRTYRRLGTARVGRDGRGTFGFAPLPSRGGRIRTYSCLVGARKLRLGAPDPVTRRCGAARVTLRR